MTFKMTESQLQILLFDWAELQRSKYPELDLMHHIPNGGFRSISTAKRLKAEGVKPGVPDICLPVPRGGHHGLYIELKTVKGRVSDHQDEWIRNLTEQGYKAVIAYGFNEAVGAIKDYLELK